MSNENRRHAMIDGLRAFADFLEGHPDVPAPYSVEANMSDTRYNGWTNYPTWAVKLWMDNEESSSRYWREVTASTWNACGPGRPNPYAETREQNARMLLATILEDELGHSPETAASPETAGMYADLLTYALGRVDWREIADSLLSACAENEAYERHAADEGRAV